MTSTFSNQLTFEKTSLLILAAGLSTRYENGHKLLAPWQGKPLIKHVTDLALSAGFLEVIIVLGAKAIEIKSHLLSEPITILTFEKYEKGMGASIAYGAKHISAKSEAVFILPADMPLIKMQHFKALLDGFNNSAHKTIIRPTFNSQKGHPVLFHKNHLVKLQKLDGDDGAKAILKAYPEQLLEVPMKSDDVIIDFDEQKDFI